MTEQNREIGADRPGGLPSWCGVSGGERVVRSGVALAGVRRALADWAIRRVVVCRDCYGTYYRSGGQYKQTTARGIVDRDLLIRHFRGEITIGAHTISTDGRCLCFVGDIDRHDDQPDADPERNRECASRRPSCSPGTGSTP